MGKNYTFSIVNRPNQQPGACDLANCAYRFAKWQAGEAENILSFFSTTKKIQPGLQTLQPEFSILPALLYFQFNLPVLQKAQVANQAFFNIFTV